MIDTQLGRRNITPIQRIAIAEKYRPGKKLWKSLEQDEARKIVRKWKKDEITFNFKKSEYPNRVVESIIEAVVTVKDCKNILF